MGSLSHEDPNSVLKEQETRILYQHIEIVKGHIPFLRYSFTKPSFFLKGFKISLPILNFLRSLR